jgi:hypothetical protein
MRATELALLMALSASVAFAGESTEDVRVWKGENSWGVIHAQVPGGLFGPECTLLWKPYLIDHALMWQWDGVVLTAAFMAPAPDGMAPTEHRQTPITADTGFAGRFLLNHKALLEPLSAAMQRRPILFWSVPGGLCYGM